MTPAAALPDRTDMAALAPPAVWAGVEPSFLTVAGSRRDQLAETGHDARLSDLDLLAELGVRAVRYPVLWGRGGQETDWEWANVRLRRLAQLGIEPIVGLLHHGWGPDGVDPLDRDYPARFAAYAVEVARRFPQIRTFLPINEPLTTARFAGLYGWWDPGVCDDAVFARLIVAQCLAIRAATRALRRWDPSIRTIVNEDAAQTCGTPELASTVSLYNDRRWLTFDLLTGRVDRGHPLWDTLAAVPGIAEQVASLTDDPEWPDVLGVDHYVTSDRFLDHRLDLYPSIVTSTDIKHGFIDVELARVAGFEVDGFWRSIRETWDRYHVPVALTEVHLGGNDTDETAWWAEAWHDALSATHEGIPVEAVTTWATFGSRGWETLMCADAGRYLPGAFDASGGRPVLTPMGKAVQDTACGHPPPPLATGWWRQPHRVIFPTGSAAAA
ncbi:MAG: glycoside hydrolase [Chloroflexota bacterium]